MVGIIGLLVGWLVGLLVLSGWGLVVEGVVGCLCGWGGLGGWVAGWLGGWLGWWWLGWLELVGCLGGWDGLGAWVAGWMVLVGWIPRPQCHQCSSECFWECSLACPGKFVFTLNGLFPLGARTKDGLPMFSGMLLGLSQMAGFCLVGPQRWSER